MLRYRPSVRKSLPGYQTTSMKRSLAVTENVEKRRKSLFWGIVNISLLGGFLFDLSYKCPLYTSMFNYLEYFSVIILSLNTVYHLCRYIYYSLKTEAVSKTSMKSVARSGSQFSAFCEEEQINKSKGHVSLNNTFERNINYSPLNWSTGWKSSNSPNESSNYSISSPSWAYYSGSPEQKAIMSSTPQKLQYSDTSGVDFITDEKSLDQYLNSYEQYEKAVNASFPSEQNTNLLSSFWNYPGNQNSNELSPYLRKSQYQLSSQTPSVPTTSGKSDEIRTTLNVSSLGSEVWQKLQIDPHTLTQWNANLRMWISQTILDRLVAEIKSVNEDFIKYHLNDVRIGSVGLERLRKTAQTMPVMQFIPTLATLLPFLEASHNQEYLVKRIKELTKGGCMSEFKWSSGGSYNGKEWDETLVNDSEIIIHLLATYLDCQLVPLPNQPDAKPFSKQHFIRVNEKVPHSPVTLAIHQMSAKPPHFRLIVGEEVFEVTKGHNNLFYTVLLFLYFVNKKEHGMLGKVNMGRSGVNMLWIIEEN